VWQFKDGRVLPGLKEVFEKLNSTARLDDFGANPANRFSHPKCPSKMLYVAMDADTCFWECFGDRMFDGGHVPRKTTWDDSSISKIAVAGLCLCELATVRTRSALTVDLTWLAKNKVALV
jgi:hypothetical protein